MTRDRDDKMMQASKMTLVSSGKSKNGFFIIYIKEKKHYDFNKIF